MILVTKVFGWLVQVSIEGYLLVGKLLVCKYSFLYWCLTQKVYAFPLHFSSTKVKFSLLNLLKKLTQFKGEHYEITTVLSYTAVNNANALYCYTNVRWQQQKTRACVTQFSFYYKLLSNNQRNRKFIILTASKVINNHQISNKVKLAFYLATTQTLASLLATIQKSAQLAQQAYQNHRWCFAYLTAYKVQ